jgi:Zn-dependent peptidase ImmA (M78 family)
MTPAAISQFESGAARPRAETVLQLGDFLEVPPKFFELALVESHEGFFRSLRRTSVTDRRKARAVAHVAHDLAVQDWAERLLPAFSSPPSRAMPIGADVEDIESAAADVREAWGISPGPAPNAVELLESRGVIVLRLPLGSADVDAFSLPFPDRPVVVLGSDKNDRARSRFDAAHELGHLVMHGDEVWGLPEVEKQAHMFAAALLMPRADIYAELPDRADWPTLFDLKRRWQVSLAALLMRARSLGRMTESAYVSAVKAASAMGWRRLEPVPLGEPEQPQMLRRLLRSAESLAARSYLPGQVLDELEAAATT